MRKPADGAVRVQDGQCSFVDGDSAVGKLADFVLAVTADVNKHWHALGRRRPCRAAGLPGLHTGQIPKDAVLISRHQSPPPPRRATKYAAMPTIPMKASIATAPQKNDESAMLALQSSLIAAPRA